MLFYTWFVHWAYLTCKKKEKSLSLSNERNKSNFCLCSAVPCDQDTYKKTDQRGAVPDAAYPEKSYKKLWITSQFLICKKIPSFAWLQVKVFNELVHTKQILNFWYIFFRFKCNDRCPGKTLVWRAWQRGTYPVVQPWHWQKNILIYLAFKVGRETLYPKTSSQNHFT